MVIKLNNLNDAKIILRILIEKGFDTYIVGGAVRDYLLKMPINDVDITTSATPKEVLNNFKGEPTGIKYGTVTISFKENKYEVTTFRSEEGYGDFRHPEEISFETSVLEDVKRRDFTMNGLLMDSSGKIIDHVDGLKAIKYKYIKTIGNPNERFSEDALRMLRAFYFQSKLAFEIDIETKKAITQNKELIKSLPNERILDELLKILQGKNLKKALEEMAETKVSEVLPGLDLGIKFYSKRSETPMIDMFFCTSFALNKKVPSEWKFSNKHRHKYQTVIKLANSKIDFDAKDLYEYGLEFCQYANRVNYTLGRSTLNVLDLEKMFHNLPIKSNQDLKFRANDILKVTNRKAGAWVNNIIKEMVNLVLDNKIKNEYIELKNFVVENNSKF